MKTITLIVLTLAAVSRSKADNDGRYHPELHGGQYNSLAQRYGKYGSIYNAYQPSYYQALNREILAPAVSYGDSVEQATAFPTTVTYRTPVTPAGSTYRPFAYSTPKSFAYSTPKSLAYSTPNPFAYSTPKPFAYSTPKSLAYSTPNPFAYSTPKSLAYSTPNPFAYSTPKPFAVSTKSPAAIYHKSVSDGAASIVRQDRTYDENNYHFAYETNNGIAAEESGIVEPSVNGGGTRVKGFYEYIGDDGLKYRVDYIADENGFRASGAHLPKAP